MTYDFETILDRAGTGSLKWEKNTGPGVLSFWLADMDFTSPPEIVEAVQKRAAHGIFGYTIPAPEYEEPVLAYLRNQHKIEATAEDLVWMPGLVPALNTAARAFCGPNETVMTCIPVYPPFLSAPNYQERILCTAPLRVMEDGRYTFDFEAMEAAITPEVKVFYLCSPHNPVGRTWSREELVAVLDFCERHDLILVSDEIHCDLLLDDAPHHASLALSEKAKERTVALYAPSKTWNLPGLACSFIVIQDAKLRNRFKRAARGMITEVNCVGYTACAAAYTQGGPWLQQLLAVLRANRDRLAAFVTAECPKISMTPIESTYLAWLDVRALGLEAPMSHFQQHGISLGDGANFGTPGWVRLTLACPPTLLEEGLKALKRGYDGALK
jgi:cystathionine beta-lyase